MNINPEELFYKDNKLFCFTAKVVDCFSCGNAYRVILDRTGFFPEAGGQSADKGTINRINVDDVQVGEKGIEHFVAVPFEKGSEVRCVIDKEERMKKERNHTGEHIISAVVHTKFGFDNVGFHIGKNEMDVDFNGDFSAEDIAFIEREANRIVMENVPVKTYFPTVEELEKIDYRSKLELSAPRIVEIVGYDFCACCAPHVSSTGEVGVIKIIDSTKNRGNTRLTVLCQADAFEYVQRVCKDARVAGSLLNVKLDSVSKAVERQLEETLALKRENTALKKVITDSVIDSLRCSDDFLTVFCQPFSIKDVLNRGIELSDKGVFVFCDCPDGFMYAIASKNLDVRIYSQELNKRFSGSGGGKPNAVQGKIHATKEQIQEYLQTLKKE